MKFKTQLLSILAVPAFAVSVVAQQPAAKPAAKPAAPAAKPAAKPAAPAAKPVAPAIKTNAQILAFLPDVLAQYNGKKITKAEFIADINKMAGPTALSQIPADKVKITVQQIIKGIIDNDLILELMKQAKITPSEQLTKDELNKQFKVLPKEQAAMLEAQLKMQGKTIQSYINEAAKNKEVQQTIAFQKWLKEKIEPGIKVSDAEVDKMYKENINAFKTPETVTASHILIMPKVAKGKEKDAKAVKAADADAKKKAEAILAKLKKDKKADFGAVAAKESQEPGAAQRKGSLGEFTRGQMVPEFEKAAFALKPGQISGVVKTAYGYHIIKVTARKPASTKTLSEVKPIIVERLKMQKMQGIIKDKLNKAYKTFKVNITKF